MDENDDLDITELVERYEQMRALGKSMYLDADEFSLLIDYYAEMGDMDEAEALIDQGLKMHPGSSEIMTQYAKKLVFAERYEEAYSYLQHISDDDNIDLALLKIETLYHLDRDDEAEAMVDRVLKQDISVEDLFTFVSELGYIYNDLDKFESANLFLEQALSLDPSNVDVLIDLAYANEMSGDFEKAIEYNNRLLDVDPYSFEGWANIGKLYSMNEQYDKAVDAFDFALTINEGDVSVLKMKALSLYLNENVEEAIRIFEDCLRQSPDDESLYDSLLEGYEAMEQYDRMLDVISRKEEKFGSKGILARKAHVYLLKQDYDKALQIYQQIPEDERDNFEFYMLEGELMFYKGDFVASETAYMKAALFVPDNETVIDRLANVSVARDKYEQAAEYLEQLLEIDPDYPSAKSRLAFIRFEIGDKEPFDKIAEQLSDEDLRVLLTLISNVDNEDYSALSRADLLRRLNELRENRVLYKNIKY
jgi:tetratricopeptide (TPR) repeat protein